MLGSDFSVRKGKAEDAEDLVRLHYDAVHENAKGDYSSDILNSWSPQPNEHRYSWMRSQIEAGDNEVLVAHEASGAISGFCMFSSSEGFVYAVYVAPTRARRGVGRRLLKCAEISMAQRGVSQAKLKASRNALDFYVSEGYDVVEATSQSLFDGSRMECYAMRKDLSSVAT